MLALNDVLPDGVWKANLLDLRNIEAQGPYCRGDPVVVPEDVDSEL